MVEEEGLWRIYQILQVRVSTAVEVAVEVKAKGGGLSWPSEFPWLPAKPGSLVAVAVANACVPGCTQGPANSTFRLPVLTLK